MLSGKWEDEAALSSPQPLVKKFMESCDRKETLPKELENISLQESIAIPLPNFQNNAVPTSNLRESAPPMLNPHENATIFNGSGTILYKSNSRNLRKLRSNPANTSSKLQLQLIDENEDEKVTKILETLIHEKKKMGSIIISNNPGSMKTLKLPETASHEIKEQRKETRIVIEENEEKEEEANQEEEVYLEGSNILRPGQLEPAYSLSPVAEEDEDNTIKKTADKLQARSSKSIDSHEKIKFTFWDYIKSYFWKSDSLNKKLAILKEGKKRIDERLDIFNVLKKLREVDKLKVLMLENEQLVLFDSLPKPHLKVKQSKPSLRARQSFAHTYLRESKFIMERSKNELIALSYESLKNKDDKTGIDEKLVDIFDGILA